MKQNVKNMRKQIIDFADSVANPKDDGCVRSKRLTDKESKIMMFLEYVQTEERIDKEIKKLLDSEYFKRMTQPNNKRKA